MLVKLDRGSFGDVADVARKFNDGNLHTQADAQIRLLLRAGPFCRLDHTLCSTVPEATRDKNAVCSADCTPGSMELFREVGSSFFLEMRGINPDKVELLIASHSAVLERFDDREVAVVEVCVFSDKCNCDGLEEALLCDCEVLPLRPSTGSSFNEGLCFGDRVKVEEFAEVSDEALLFEEDGDVVGGRNVMHCKDLVAVDLAEHGDFVHGRFLERYIASTCDLRVVSASDSFMCRKYLTKSGTKPSLPTSLIACCVGLVFCSPAMTGTSET